MPQNRILVIRGGAIGDFVLTLPVLAALRTRFPESRLEILGYPHIAQLATVGGLADAVQPIEARALAGFFAAGGTLDPVWQRYFSEFAIIISFLYDPDGVFRANVARASTAVFIEGPHRPDDQGVRHATETFLQPLERLAIFEADPQPRLRIPMDEKSDSEAVAFHPGSGSERKNWPVACWAELLTRVANEIGGARVLLGGEADEERIRWLASRVPMDGVEVVLGQPLIEVARRLRRCRMLVGHDSGITHLAAALGLGTVVLWGPTAERVWAPRGEHVRVLRKPGGLETLTPVEVWEALRRGGQSM